MSDDASIQNPGYTARRGGRYGRAPRGTGLSPDNRRLMMYAGGLGAVLVVMIGASMLTGRHSGPPPVVEPASGPVRVKPENPGGMKIDAAESDVFSGAQDTDNAKLAPAPEVPNPNGLQAQSKPKPKPVPTAEAPAQAAARTVEPAKPVARETPAIKDAGHEAVKDKEPAAKVARDAPTPARTTVASTEPAAKPTSGASSGHAAIQLAALSSEQGAKEEWQRLQRQMPELLGGRQPMIQKAEHEGKTFYRLRTTGFADLSQARGFCDKVRAKGGSCSVATF
ncbi:SPOR domain-containing protein [Rhodopila sp.]|jgi:hypothetical protein|uniref:SPOR domain-containing protein n=1 Tax=Rhodopila sp. TaxID=2480087 RepID=UPI002C0C7F11|nr:SPOR domain-containing protein [Rhodopila sp.]HVZ06546.1 SPOR domain-containing protein [Rhodopila sp.]